MWFLFFPFKHQDDEMGVTDVGRQSNTSFVNLPASFIASTFYTRRFVLIFSQKFVQLKDLIPVLALTTYFPYMGTVVSSKVPGI